MEKRQELSHAADEIKSDQESSSDEADERATVASHKKVSFSPTHPPIQHMRSTMVYSHEDISIWRAKSKRQVRNHMVSLLLLQFNKKSE